MRGGTWTHMSVLTRLASFYSFPSLTTDSALKSFKNPQIRQLNASQFPRTLSCIWQLCLLYQCITNFFIKRDLWISSFEFIRRESIGHWLSEGFVWLCSSDAWNPDLKTWGKRKLFLQNQRCPVFSLSIMTMMTMIDTVAVPEMASVTTGLYRMTRFFLWWATC